MPLYKRAGSPHWWIRGSVAGERYRKSSGTDDADKAAEFEHALRDRIWRARKLGDRGAISIREAAERWLRTRSNSAAEGDRQRIEWFLAIPGVADAPLSAITAAENSEFQASLLAQGLKPATVDRYMGCWGSFLHSAAHGSAPVPMLNPRPRAARWLTPDEFERLRAQLPRHLEIAARFAVYTGLREGAQRSLKWSQVDFQARRAWIAPEFMKNGKPHGFPLSDSALQALQDAQAFQREQAAEMFAEKRVAPIPEYVWTWYGEPVRKFNTRAYREAVRAAALQGATWHTLRHTFASWAVQGGVTLQELMQLGPWAGYSMVLRYAHLAPDCLAPAVEAVAKMGAGQQSEDTVRPSTGNVIPFRNAGVRAHQRKGRE